MRESIATSSPDISDPTHPPLGITHLRQLRDPATYAAAPSANAEAPLDPDCEVKPLPQIPLVWPSVARHEPSVNISITKFLISVQILCDSMELLTPTGGGQDEVKDAFAKMVQEWLRVQESLVECCAQDTRDVEDGMCKIHRIVSHIVNMDGHARFTDRQAVPMFQDTMRDEVVNVLRAKGHISDY